MHGDLRPPTALLIDLDDTLIDFTGGQRECWQITCAEVGDLPPGLAAEHAADALLDVSHRYWGEFHRHQRGRRDLRATSATIYRLAMRSLGVRVSQTSAREAANHFRDLREQYFAVFPGVLETLERLRDHGHALALVTNGTATDQRAKLDRFDLARYFDHIQIEGEFGAGKPEPEVYAAALDALDVAPGEAWFVGDHLEYDVFGPMRAGIAGVWVTHGRPLPGDAAQRPHLAIDRFADLP